MNKTIFLILSVLILALVIGGCSKGDGTTSEKTGIIGAINR